MAETQYTYDVTTEFPGGKVNPGTLQTEIQASGIVTAIERIDTAGGALSLGTLTGGSIAIVFKDALSAGDVTVLDGDATGPAGGLIAAHNNSPVQSTPTQREDGVIYSVPKPSSFGFEMCDRDFKLKTCMLTEPAEDLKLDTTTMLETPWGEMSLVGLYKNVGGSMVECADQTDADTNCTLTVFEYTAKVGGSPVDYELRDGMLYVDPSLAVNWSNMTESEKWDYRAYAIGAPAIPAGSGGSLAIFDAYLGMAPNREVTALSPQAMHLNPSGPAGAAGSVIRLYLIHPAGSKLTHVMRLVTYRQPGTY